MQTSLRIDGANCSTCFNETLEELAHLDGVRSVHGSFAGPCIELDHDAALETIIGAIRNRLHGIEMFANEIRMVPLEPVPLTTTCTHHGRTHAEAARGSGVDAQSVTEGLSAAHVAEPSHEASGLSKR